MGKVTSGEGAEQTLQQWISALDALDDLIFIHDADFRILRCNRAYQQQAGLPFEQILGGRPYFELFPKRETPLSNCLYELEYPCDTIENSEEIEVEGTVFRSRSHAITDKDGEFLYSVHILEDITRQKADKEKLKQNEMFVKTVLENLPVGVAVSTACPEVNFSYMNDTFPKLYRATRDALKTPNAFWEAAYEDPELRQKIKKQATEDCKSGQHVAHALERYSDHPQRGKDDLHFGA
ncbi:MAG: PAS domain-containing protein [Sulfurimonas sp.]